MVCLVDSSSSLLFWCTWSPEINSFLLIYIIEVFNVIITSHQERTRLATHYWLDVLQERINLFYSPCSSTPLCWINEFHCIICLVALCDIIILLALWGALPVSHNVTHYYSDDKLSIEGGAEWKTNKTISSTFGGQAASNFLLIWNSFAVNDTRVSRRGPKKPDTPICVINEKRFVCIATRCF